MNKPNNCGSISGQHHDKCQCDNLPTRADAEPLSEEALDHGVLCGECGVGIKIDEDGCCKHCGRDAVGHGIDMVFTEVRRLRAGLEKIIAMDNKCYETTVESGGDGKGYVLGVYHCGLVAREGMGVGADYRATVCPPINDKALKGGE